MYQFYKNLHLKRLLDIAISLPLLILLSPLMLFIILVLRRKGNKSPFFRQLRPGLHARIFPLYKFKSMVDAYDDQGNLLPDVQRITKFGNFLRKTSLDELPQLYNVLKGDMSLVGPRPLLTEYLALYSPRQQKRHWVRPGITGFAQINGRNAIQWEQKFELDVWYVEHCSCWLDLKILMKTFFIVIKAKGISQPGEATIKKFKG